MNYLSQVAATLLAAAVLIAWGGDGFDTAAIAAVLPGAGLDTETPRQARVEGCVVDADGRPPAPENARLAASAIPCSSVGAPRS